MWAQDEHAELIRILIKIDYKFAMGKSYVALIVNNDFCA